MARHHRALAEDGPVGGYQIVEKTADGGWPDTVVWPGARAEDRHLYRFKEMVGRRGNVPGYTFERTLGPNED
jgi:hypothetical protein